MLVTRKKSSCLAHKHAARHQQRAITIGGWSKILQYHITAAPYRRALKDLGHSKDPCVKARYCMKNNRDLASGWLEKETAVQAQALEQQVLAIITHALE